MPLSIVVAEDAIDLAETFATLFRLQGHEVHVCTNGQDAFDSIRIHRPRVAVVDIGLPIMSGLEVVKRAKSQAWGKDVTYIGVSGHGTQADFLLAREAGFDFYLVKPPDLAVLTAILDQLR